MFEEQLSKLPPEPPRPPALLPGLRFRSVLSLGTLTTPLVIIGLLTLVLSSMELFHPSRSFLLGHSNVTNGTVVKVTDDRRTNRIEITYKFRSGDGQEYRRIQEVPAESAYAGVQTGDPVPVEFLVTTPAMNRIALRNDLDGNPFFFLFLPVFFFLVIVAPTVISRFIRIHRDRRLFRRGWLSTGTVVFVKPGAVFMWWGWSGASTAEVYVCFMDKSGTQIEAKALCQNDWLLKHLAPGTPVHLAYLPKRSSHAALLDAYVR